MRNCRKNALKNKKGITLIALVITIIVLLILAGISISMLSGDNGILQKATTAKENTNNSQIQERINIAYHSSLAGGQGEVTEPSLENEIKKEFNKTTLEEGWLDKTSIEGKWRITIDDVYLDVPAGITNIPQAVINYGNKTAETVEVNDDIIIGSTEKFKVIKKSEDGKTITAIPYYNLKLDETPIKQVTEENAGSGQGEAGKIEFSSVASPTWGAGEDIDLDTHENNVKSYIEAYQTTLRNLGANNVTTRIARYQEMIDVNNDNEPSTLCNPSGIGDYWLGSSGSSGANTVFIVSYAGYCTNIPYKSSIGVRPVLVINL